MITCCRRPRTRVVGRCCPTEPQHQFQYPVSDQTAAQSRLHRTEQNRLLVLPRATAWRRLVEGTVRPALGPASRQDRAELVTSRPSSSWDARRAPSTGRPSLERPPTAIQRTRSAGLLAGTGADLRTRVHQISFHTNNVWIVKNYRTFRGLQQNCFAYLA